MKRQFVLLSIVCLLSMHCAPIQAMDEELPKALSALGKRECEADSDADLSNSLEEAAVALSALRIISNRAKNTNDPEIMYKISQLHAPVSVTLEFEWCMKAAKIGHAAAAFRLGQIYENALLPGACSPNEIDRVKAYRFYQKAAHAGSQEAKTRLSTMQRPREDHDYCIIS